MVDALEENGPIWGGRVRRLRERAAIVTGAASALGRAVTQWLGREGAVLALWDHDADGLEVATAEARSLGLVVESGPAGVLGAAEAGRAVDGLVERWTRVDLLVLGPNDDLELVEEVASRMIEGGVVVVTATGADAATRAAVVRKWGRDWAGRGLRVNGVDLGTDDADEKTIELQARVIGFLASSDAALICGQTLGAPPRPAIRPNAATDA